MNKKLIFMIFLALWFFLLVIATNGLEKSFYAVYPSFQETISMQHSLEDAGFLLMGFRSLGSDAAWIQLLQYTSEGGFEAKAAKGISYALYKHILILF